MLADAELMAYSADGPLGSVDDVRIYLAEEAAPGNQRTWAITRAGDDRAIGWVSGSEADGAGVTEIGFILAREAWGRGIAREAVSIEFSMPAMYSDFTAGTFSDPAMAVRAVKMP